MAESQENNSNANKSFFDIKFKERGRRDNRRFYTEEHYRNQIKGANEAGLSLNKEARENFKKISREFGGIIADKEEVSRIDPLTKIFNVEAFNDELKIKMEESKRFNLPLTLVFIDIDDFKKLNKKLGHTKCSDLLISFAQTVQGSKRKIDIWGRVGGDEFALLLPSANHKNTESIMKRLEDKVRKKIKSNFDGLKLGISYGIYQYNGEEDFKDFLKKADDKLYEVKRQKHG